MTHELFKQVVRPKRMDEKGEEKSLTWQDVKTFCDTLAESELNQNLQVWGDEKGGGIYAISIAIDEGINPSGDSIEPRMLYSKSANKEDREIAHDEVTVVKKGTIILEADF